MSNYEEHCLRPYFTKDIIRLLQGGRSINLVGNRGTGRKRLLEDIQACHLPNTRTVLVNVQSFCESYNGFLQDIWSQLALEGDKPITLSGLIERAVDRNQQLFIFLYNFDALLNTPWLDPQYDRKFYDALNHIKNNPKVALICVTQTPHTQKAICIEKRIYRSSWLDLKIIQLPELAYDDILPEIERHKELFLTDDAKSFISNSVRHHEEPYAFLDYVLNQIVISNRKNEKIDFPTSLKKWKKEFKRHFGASWVTRFLKYKHGYEVLRDILCFPPQHQISDNLLASPTAAAESMAAQIDVDVRASRQRMTAALEIKAKEAEEKFDVFLSYNSKDKAAVEKIAKQLLDVGLRPWFDAWELVPGDVVLDALEQAIKTIPCAVLCFGPSDIGKWHIMEIRAYVQKWASENVRIIPVILPNVQEAPELPLFVGQTLWVDMRDWENDESDGFYRLVCGIRGKAPGDCR
jgi:hypothetical protein